MCYMRSQIHGATIVLKDKLKNIIPEMEKFIKDSEIDKMERGFTFRTNTDTKIEEYCQSGSTCWIAMEDIVRKEGTKTGNFHTHPHTTMKNKKTHAIGGVFSCGDILLQAINDIDHACVGTNDEIVCSTLKLRIPSAEKFELHDCISLHHLMRKRKDEIKDYKGSELEKENIKKLDRLEAELDKDIRPYMDFEIIKKLK